jgi:DNA-binding IclR family transcriptional regulator
MAGNSGDPGRTVASKVAVILAAFAAGAEHTLSQIAYQTRLPVSTVHRLLRDLVAAELLDRCGDGGYRAAWALRTLDVDSVEPTLADRAPLMVDDLAAALQTTARVGVLDALEISYVEKVPGVVCGTSFPNTARLPLHATALGKALLAFLRPVVVRLVITQGLSSYTPYTVIRADQLQCALQHARVRGFAISAGELDLSCAVAVPVFDAGGGVIAGVEVQVDDLAGPTLA